MADQRLGIRLDITSLYNNIKPGDTTHEGTCSKFNGYFQKFSRRMKTYVHSSQDELIIQQLPCFVLQVAYDYCQQFILTGPLMKAFCDNVKNYVIPNELQRLSIYKTSCTGLKRHESLNSLFQLNSIDSEGELWELFKAGYGAFLFISEAKSHQSFDTLINETLNTLPNGIPLPEERIKEMVEEAVKLAWSVLTLVPPALLSQPDTFNEDWHEKRITSWNTELPSSDPVVYFRPILFYSALGHVGCKGAIGNTQSKGIHILQCQYCPVTDCNECNVSVHMTEQSENECIKKTERVTRTPNITNNSIEQLHCRNSTLVEEERYSLLERGNPFLRNGENSNRLEGRICSTSVDEDYLLSTLSQSNNSHDEPSYNISSDDQRKLSPSLETYNHLSQSQEAGEENHLGDNTINGHHDVTNTSLPLKVESPHLCDDHLTNCDVGNNTTITTTTTTVTIRTDASDSSVITDTSSLQTHSSSPSLVITNNSTDKSVTTSNNESHDKEKDQLEEGSNSLLSQVINLCHDIKAGDITHEDVLVTFNEYFGTFNRRVKVFVRYRNVLQQLPCAVLQAAYDLCVEYMLSGSVMNSFLTSKEFTQLPEMIKEFFMDKEDEGDLSYVNHIFKLGVERMEDKWRDLKTSYSCLLHVSKMKSFQPFTEIINKVLSILPHWSGDCFREMIERAVHIAWNMVSLVPPPLLCQPMEYNEEWHERRTTFWSDDIQNDSSEFIYFQPVLFYSALGHVATEGIVGNTLSDRMEILSNMDTLVIVCNTDDNLERNITGVITDKCHTGVDECNAGVPVSDTCVPPVDECNTGVPVSDTCVPPVDECNTGVSVSDTCVPPVDECNTGVSVSDTAIPPVDECNTGVPVSDSDVLPVGDPIVRVDEYHFGMGVVNLWVNDDSTGSNSNVVIAKNDTVVITTDSMRDTKSIKHVSYYECEVYWLPCSQCGKHGMITSGNSICQQCIQSNEFSSMNEGSSDSSANDWFSLSLLTLLCCFWPFSIIAIINSINTRRYIKHGQYSRANETSRRARKYNLLSVTFGSIITLTSMIGVLICLIYIAISM